MVLKELNLTVSTDFNSWAEGVVVLKELILTVSTFVKVWQS